MGFVKFIKLLNVQGIQKREFKFLGNPFYFSYRIFRQTVKNFPRNFQNLLFHVLSGCFSFYLNLLSFEKQRGKNSTLLNLKS